MKGNKGSKLGTPISTNPRSNHRGNRVWLNNKAEIFSNGISLKYKYHVQGSG